MYIMKEFYTLNQNFGLYFVLHILDFQDFGHDIETGIETFRGEVMILRLLSILSE